jgi:hypothetical protein
MAEISNQQIYDLLLEILYDVIELDASIDELLFDMKALNQELSVDRHRLMEEVCPK